MKNPVHLYKVNQLNTIRQFFLNGWMIFFLISCEGKNFVSNVSQLPVPSGSSLPRKSPRGKTIFKTSLTAAELEVERRTFLAQSVEVHLNPSSQQFLYTYKVPFFRFDEYRSSMFMVQVPVFATYHNPNAQVGLAVRWPKAFLLKIPQDIQNAVNNSEATQLDIFLAVQKYAVTYGVLDEDVRFRAHFWLVPGPHDVSTNRSGNIQVGFYNFDHMIEGDFKDRGLVDLHWSIHPDHILKLTLYSPSNANVDMRKEQANNSGWSLVLDKSSGRAAVTLHGIYDETHYEHLMDQLKSLKPLTIQSVLAAIDQLGDPFSSLGLKLKTLIN